MSHEVVAAHVVGALSKVIAVLKIPIDADALCSDSTHGHKTDSTRLLRENPIEVVKNRPVWRKVHIWVSRASSPPCDLAIKAKVAPDNEIGSEAWIHTSGERLRRVVEVVRIECSR